MSQNHGVAYTKPGDVEIQAIDYPKLAIGERKCEHTEVCFYRVACLVALAILSALSSVNAQHSVARKWNEVLLQAIRNDFARPTVHARNLFHVSMAMYDAWAIYDSVASTYLLNTVVNEFSCPCGTPASSNIEASREEAISYAAFRVINHRFVNSPGYLKTKKLADSLMTALGFDQSFTSKDISSGSSAALGNRIADCVIRHGLRDGSNEQDGYVNVSYQPVNPPLIAEKPGPQGLIDPNRWQPLAFDVFIDQAGNVFPSLITPFLGPEWGKVFPFALKDESAAYYTRSDATWKVSHDPGAPPYLAAPGADISMSKNYKWCFSLVNTWSSHLDPRDGVMWDISPKSMGNISDFPSGPDDYENFYDRLNGGDIGAGYTINPKTNLPYTAQLVPRGDYTRVLAEFWADGPTSETPPGHWFVILNHISDHPLLEKKFEGSGRTVGNLEWDVKSYFVLGGAMHDVAVCAWGIKGWYDYVRPISAIRYMGASGQSSDPALPNYSPHGFELIDGYIELVKENDPLVGANNENLNKIKLYSWRGPKYISDPKTETVGVGWILAENWWPYQRPTFITPPFAGYISGHSTYSRAAAEVLTAFTGDPYFPGGMAEFDAPKNKYLVFEEGPSVDVVLQWATYRDAADQCSLSRIWGGIHPPADDIPGRKIGRVVGTDAFEFAKEYFEGKVENVVGIDDVQPKAMTVYPNPLDDDSRLYIVPKTSTGRIQASLYNSSGQLILTKEIDESSGLFVLDLPDLGAGLYLLKLGGKNIQVVKKLWKQD